LLRWPGDAHRGCSEIRKPDGLRFARHSRGGGILFERGIGMREWKIGEIVGFISAAAFVLMREKGGPR
jgi:hypothetical protein